MFWIIVLVIIVIIIAKSISNTSSTNIDPTPKETGDASQQKQTNSSTMEFSKINRSEELKNSNIYVLVKLLSIELIKNGYRLEDSVKLHKYGDTGYINIYLSGEHLGYIVFSKRCYANGMFFEEKKIRGENIQSYPFKYTVIRDGQENAGILIRPMTKTIPPETPDWMTLCANVYKSKGLRPQNPEWYGEYDSHQFVNTMF